MPIYHPFLPNVKNHIVNYESQRRIEFLSQTCVLPWDDNNLVQFSIYITPTERALLIFLQSSVEKWLVWLGGTCRFA